MVPPSSRCALVQWRAGSSRERNLWKSDAFRHKSPSPPLRCSAPVNRVQTKNQWACDPWGWTCPGLVPLSLHGHGADGREAGLSRERCCAEQPLLTGSGLLLHHGPTLVSVGLFQSQAEDLLQRNARRGGKFVCFWRQEWGCSCCPRQFGSDFIFFSCRVRGTNCTGIVVNWSRSPELFLNVKLQQGFPPPPLTSNMTSLSGTKERSVSSRSRKYGVGYSSEWGGHTSVICNVMSDIKSIASSTRWCAVHLAGSLISVSFLRHPWMWSFITDPRPVLTDRVVHASPLSFVFTARTPACVYYDPLRTEHTHLCLWRPPPIKNHIRPTLGSTVQPLIAYL